MPQMSNISLEISNPCNERCIHCYRVCDGTKRGFLSAEQAQRVLEQAKTLGTQNVMITGGEALLNPEWKEIVQIADNLNYKISLFSNGTLLSDLDVDFLANITHLKEVQVSLYALDESVHDEITGLKGSCLKTKNAIRLLRERNIPLFISCPVMKKNKKAVLDLMNWCEDNGINWCTDIFIFGTSDYAEANLVHRLSFSELEEFFDETMKDNGKLSDIWAKSYTGYDFSKLEFYNGATHSLCVSGDGTVYPAVGWYEPLGNIETDDIADLFTNHPLLQKLRTIHVNDIAECRNCKCSDFCDFCFSPHIAANNGELCKLDAEFCKFVALKKQLAKRRDEMMKINDMIENLAKTIGKKITETEKPTVYEIESVGRFVIIPDKTQKTGKTQFSQDNTAAISAVVVIETDVDCITITPESNTRNSIFPTKSCITIDANNEFYGTDGKKIPTAQIFEKLQDLYNSYNNPVNCIRK